jgi:hypothetical protein
MGRAEKIDLLVGKTESLNQQAFRFKKQSGNLKSAMWWRNMKLNCLILAIVLVSCMPLMFDQLSPRLSVSPFSIGGDFFLFCFVFCRHLSSSSSSAYVGSNFKNADFFYGLFFSFV